MDIFFLMPEEYTNLDHATHNEEVCSHLDDNTKYSDWIITTAFYSAMHFMKHKIFPLKIIDQAKMIEHLVNGYYTKNNLVLKS